MHESRTTPTIKRTLRVVALFLQQHIINCILRTDTRALCALAVRLKTYRTRKSAQDRAPGLQRGGCKFSAALRKRRRTAETATHTV